MPRFFVPLDLTAGEPLTLPLGASRHVQVRRLQPGQRITLFNGAGGEWAATITGMTRSSVAVRVEQHVAMEREAARAVHLTVGLMASDRMDWLVEKATELGATSLTPIAASRSQLRLGAQAAQKKRERWQALAASACEQSGRNRLPEIHAPLALPEFLAQSALGARWLLSLDPAAAAAREQAAALPAQQPVTLLSGPEGGLTAQEEDLARAAGYLPMGLGPRTLRAETAPLAALALLA